jgi:hypothetical protein
LKVKRGNKPVRNRFIIRRKGMKTMFKKCGLCAAVAVALLSMMVLVTGCPAGPVSQGYKPPAGMGAVQLRFSDTIARATILPPEADINIFQRFWLDFQPVALPAQAYDGYYTLAELNTPIPLVPGDYTLVVIGYLVGGDPGAATPILPTQAAAIASVSITIDPGVNTETIILRAYDPDEADEDGTFSWTIANKVTALTAAAMDITKIGGGSVYNETFDEDEDSWAGTEDLTEGYYYVDFTLTAGVTRHFRHVLHIYRNMTSTFIYEFNDEKLGILSTTLKANLEYEYPEDMPPELSGLGGATGEADDPVTLSLGTPAVTITLTVDNDTAYDDIEWFYGSTSLGTGETYVVDVTNSPFDEEGTYQIAVVGTTAAGVPYFTEIFIKVDE